MSNGWLSLDFIKSHFRQLESLYKTSPLSFAAVYFLIYLCIAAFAIPGAAPFTLLGGAVFGLFFGTLIVSFASTLGSTVAFLLARHFFREPLIKKYGDKIEVFNRRVEKDGALYLFFLRMNPIFPFFMINSIMGLTSMQTWRYFWVSQIGMLPGTLLYVNAGTQLGKIESIEKIVSWPILISFFLLGVFPFAVQFIFKKKTHTKKV